jgi:hypothetical protein
VGEFPPPVGRRFLEFLEEEEIHDQLFSRGGHFSSYVEEKKKTYRFDRSSSSAK